MFVDSTLSNNFYNAACCTGAVAQSRHICYTALSPPSTIYETHVIIAQNTCQTVMAFKRPRASSPSSSQKRARGAEAANKSVFLGTELPPDEDADDGAFVPIWKQTVTDERGRRRLHGAFTGGFSAG